MKTLTTTQKPDCDNYKWKVTQKQIQLILWFMHDIQLGHCVILFHLDIKRDTWVEWGSVVITD